MAPRRGVQGDGREEGAPRITSFVFAEESCVADILSGMVHEGGRAAGLALVAEMWGEGGRKSRRVWARRPTGGGTPAPVTGRIRSLTLPDPPSIMGPSGDGAPLRRVRVSLRRVRPDPTPPTARVDSGRNA